jgi:flagellar basal body-associated protein FliL
VEARDVAEKAATEGKKKKGGKLPLIIGIVALAGGGGFFAAKGAGGSKPAEKKVELGEIAPLGEFLVNLSDGRTFLRAEISVHVAKGEHLDPHAAGGGGGHGGGEAAPPAPIRDAVIEVLTSQSLASVSSVAGKARLKKQLAAAINEAAHALHPAEPGKEKGKDEKHDEEKADKKESGHKDWDAADGPVLKVYFTSFATQQ